MTSVKICGITNIDDARAALQCGADALGFIFAEQSVRSISVENAAAVVRELDPYCVSVGVFMDHTPAKVMRIVESLRLTAVQLHGKEDRAFCKKFFKRVKVIKTLFPERQNLDKIVLAYRGVVDAFLLDVNLEDKHKGRNQFRWKDIRGTYSKFFSSGEKVIISGGLDPDNVEEAIRIFNPYAVDVARGVEYADGLKDPRLIKMFIHRVKNQG